MPAGARAAQRCVICENERLRSSYTIERTGDQLSANEYIPPPTGGRDFPGAFPSGRVLVIGLDGATWDVLRPLMDEGRMPRLKRLVECGASGVLRSTIPPITPAAWTTFLTGVQPGTHGIIDFERYDPRRNKLALNSTRSLDHVRNLWQILSDRGLKVGCVNCPMTYPPIEVNGFLVSGFETPGPSADFVYPKEIREELLTRWPDPTIQKSWKRKRFGGDALFERNVDYMIRSFYQGAEMTMWLGDRHGWDALMVVMKLIDNLQHKTWKYIDPRYQARNPKRCEIVKNAFAEADKAVGLLLDYAERYDATTILVSDHGHGSLEGKVQPNLLLKQWGYLHLRAGGAQGATRIRHIVDRLAGRKQQFSAEDDVLKDLAVDFSRTRACVMHAGMAGFVYLNLEGRQPCGIVPKREYEALRDELIDRFLGDECKFTMPGGERVGMFAAVHKPEEIYNCSREDQPWMPDLILTPRDGLAVVRKIRGRKPVRMLPYSKMEGTHRREGIIAAGGPGIAEGNSLTADMVDCAPTILSMLGLRIPETIEGRVLTEIFEAPPPVETVAAGVAMGERRGGEEVYSEEDMAAITERLSDLGYLE